MTGHFYIVLLNIGDYAPEIRSLTLPFIERYAKYVGADILQITERKFPEWDVDYEKLQLYEIGQGLKRKHGSDPFCLWYIDSDAILHPDLPDLRTLVKRDQVAMNAWDLACIRWRYNDWMFRDGRHIGACCWNMFAWDWGLDLWRPLEMSYAEAVQNIRTTETERRSKVVTEPHLVTDYAVSLNIARFGLKCVKFNDWLSGDEMFFHVYTLPRAEKVAELKAALARWKLL